MNRNMHYRPNLGSGSLEPYQNLEHKREQLQQRGGKQQQKMAPNNKQFNRKRQFGIEQQPQNFAQYEFNQGSVQNFAYLYDNGPGVSYDRGYIPNKKRQKINVWDIDMFGANQIPGIQCNNTFAVHQNNPPRPLMSLPGLAPKIRPVPKVPPKARKNIVPIKAAKPIKPKPVQPIKSSAPPVDKEQYMLRADKVPCQQTVGRLELALGSILKEMRANLCTNSESYSLFTSKVIQRSIKQTIRERIKSVMLNKYVGKYVDIIETYRKRYPQNTDKDVLDIAVIKTGNAQQQIKQNFDKILIRKVNSMFKKLQVLVNEKEMEVAQLIEARQIFKDDKKTEKEIKHAVKNESDYYASIVDSLLAARLPKLLPNYSSCILKIMKSEGLLNQTNEDGANNDDSVPIELPDSDTDDDVVEVNLDAKKDKNNDTIISIQDEEMAETNDEEMAETNDEEMVKTNDEEMAETNDKEMAETNDKEMAEANDKVTTEDVSDAQNDHKEDDNIEKLTEKKEPEPNAETDKNNEMNTEPNKDNTEISKEKTSPEGTLYLVKVLCHPELPSKGEAYKFLNKFNMVNVKKHKTIQNLLVVGFNNEKDYNDILAANGTVIEKSKLTIRGSNVASNDNQILSPEMDKQMNDFLSTMRQKVSEVNDQNTTAEETEVANQDAKPENNSNVSPQSNPCHEETELNTITETDEPQDEQDTAENGTAEVTKDTGADGDANADGNENPDDIKSTSEDIDVRAANVDETSADADKSPAEPIDKSDKEENADTVAKINKDAKSTPARSISRLVSTPSSVRTRRASRLAQIN